jgi:hypothetical protein
MNLKLSIDGIDQFLKELEDDGVVQAGVSVEGPAAAYALVWEWGNARQTKKGPKTVLGTNPKGERVWLSSQAPVGYIWTNTPKFLDSISQELKQVSFSGTTKQSVTSELKRASLNIAKQMADVISEAAPVDTGQLESSFRPLASGDPMLEENGG